MSFSKSKVPRFGEKQKTLISATKFNANSRDSARRQKSVVNASFIVAGSVRGDTEDAIGGDKAEARKKIKTCAVKHSYLSSKIGRPNFLKKTKSTICKNAEIEGVHHKYSLTTVESCKSCPPTSRILSVPRSPRTCSLETSRARSFATLPGTTNISPDFQKRNLEMQFNIKSKRLEILKKDLLEKQKHAVELYKTMMSLRNKFKEIDGRELQLEELKIVEYPDIKLLDETQKEEEEEKLRFYKSKLQSTPAIFMELCRQILDDKCRILDKILDDEGQWDQDNLMKNIQSHKEEAAKLEGRIESRLSDEDGKLHELISKWYQIAKMHIGDGMDPTNIACDLEIKLQETEHKMKEAISDLQIEKSKKHKDLFDKNVLLEKDLKTIRDKYHELTKTLEEERTKSLCQNERKTMLEHKIKIANDRMKEAETMKQDLELQLDKLTEMIKKKEEEWQSKENYLEAKCKECEHAIYFQKQEIEKQERHSADVRIKELREEFKVKEEDYLKKQQQLEFELNELKSQKDNIEKDYDALRVKLVNSKKKKLEYKDTASKSAAEITLWKELIDTKSALKLAEEKLAVYAQEKIRFVDTVNENYPSAITPDLQQKTSRANKQQFINHVQNLYTHEVIRFRQRLHSCFTLQNSETGKSSNRPHSVHICPFDNSRTRCSYSLVKMCKYKFSL